MFFSGPHAAYTPPRSSASRKRGQALPLRGSMQQQGGANSSPTPPAPLSPPRRGTLREALLAQAARLPSALALLLRHFACPASGCAAPLSHRDLQATLGALRMREVGATAGGMGSGSQQPGSSGRLSAGSGAHLAVHCLLPFCTAQQQQRRRCLLAMGGCCASSCLQLSKQQAGRPPTWCSGTPKQVEAHFYRVASEAPTAQEGKPGSNTRGNRAAGSRAASSRAAAAAAAAAEEEEAEVIDLCGNSGSGQRATQQAPQGAEAERDILALCALLGELRRGVAGEEGQQAVAQKDGAPGSSRKRKGPGGGSGGKAGGSKQHKAKATGVCPAVQWVAWEGRAALGLVCGSRAGQGKGPAANYGPFPG